MPRALITGGSAGLGRALAAGLVARDWDVIITGRDENRLVAVARDLGPRVTPLAGDVTDAGHRSAIASACGRARPARQQRQHPRPEPTAAGAGAGRPGAARRLGDQRRRAGGPDPRPSAVPRTRGGGHQPHVRRGGRSLRDMGRVRREQGRARAPDAHARGRGAQACAGGPSTPATCVRRCTRTRSPVRTSRTGRCPRASCRLPGAARQPAAERAYRAAELVPANAARHDEDRHHAVDTFAPPRPHGAVPAEARGLGRDDVRLLVAHGDRLTHARFGDLADHLEPGDLVVVDASQTIAGEVDPCCRARAPQGRGRGACGDRPPRRHLGRRGPHGTRCRVGRPRRSRGRP